MSPEGLLQGLSDAQREAATHGAGPLLVAAGPGAGKTRTLTTRLAYLIQSGQAAPEELCAVTFTRKAAAELAERLRGLLGSAAARVGVGTFHALAARLFAPEGHVLSEGERQALLHHAAADVGADRKRLQQLLTRAQGNLTGADVEQRAQQLGAWLEGDAAARLLAGYRAYEALKRELQALDLDDLLLQALHRLRGAPRPWRLISVDEYQDVNRVQRELLRALGGPGGDVFAIGDPDQAIYGFRGADVGSFFAFAEDFPGARLLQLADNRRSSGTIVEAAAALITHNRRRASGRPRATRAAGERLQRQEAATEAAEARRIALEVERLVGGTSLHSHDQRRVAAHARVACSFADIAVLCRTSARADQVAEALQQAGVPVQRPRRVRAEVEPAAALLDYLQRRGPGGGEAAPWGAEEAELAHESDELDLRAERVAVLTLHGSKGLEFTVVFLAGCEAGGIRADADLEEERRLFYVGMTRAKDLLYLSWARRGRFGEAAPSPFLQEIPAACCAAAEVEAPKKSKRPPQLKLF